MDLPGRSILYGVNNAFVYNQRGQIPLVELPDEIRKEQIKTEGYPQDCVRLVIVDSHESTVKLDVFSSKCFKKYSLNIEMSLHPYDLDLFWILKRLTFNLSIIHRYSKKTNIQNECSIFHLL